MDNNEKIIEGRPGKIMIAEAVIIMGSFCLCVIITLLCRNDINPLEYKSCMKIFGVIGVLCIAFCIHIMQIYKNVRIKVYGNIIEYTDKHGEHKKHTIEEIEKIKWSNKYGKGGHVYCFKNSKDKMYVSRMFSYNDDMEGYIFMYRWEHGLDERKKWKSKKH